MMADDTYIRVFDWKIEVMSKQQEWGFSSTAFLQILADEVNFTVLDYKSILTTNDWKKVKLERCSSNVSFTVLDYRFT